MFRHTFIARGVFHTVLFRVNENYHDTFAHFLYLFRVFTAWTPQPGVPMDIVLNQESKRKTRVAIGLRDKVRCSIVVCVRV